MNGLHLIADLHECQCRPARLLDAQALETFCLEACRRHGLTPVGRLFHVFGNAAGVTGAIVLAESHLAIHTWPELGAVTLDLYVCNFSGDNSLRAEALFTEIVAHFAPARRETQRVERGRLSGAPS